MDSGFPQRSVTSPALQEVLQGGGSDSEAQSFHCPPARARVTPGAGWVPSCSPDSQVLVSQLSILA